MVKEGCPAPKVYLGSTLMNLIISKTTYISIMLLVFIEDVAFLTPPLIVYKKT
jgi:hypothetical protein